MHVNPDLIVEMVHPKNRDPVNEGEPGRIVATDLQRVTHPADALPSSDRREL